MLGRFSAWGLIAGALFHLSSPSRLAAAPPGPVEAAREAFAARVRPILNRNCFHCHNSEKPKRGLNLTRLATLLEGGKSGAPVKPGSAKESLIFRVVQPGSDPHMPPQKQLDPAEIAVLGRWIDGLPADLEVEALKREEVHWAFRPVLRPEVPRVRTAGWARTPIDAFILARLEASGIGPSPEAAKGDLLRRAALDLTGLPSTPEELDAFLLDDSPAAFEKALDRLLASPRYGERWARHWLDLSRYAESEGFKSDETRPNAWRWRDYVIRSLNQDKPYDRFIREQIAGDELWPEDPDARLATAFNRHYPDESNARNLMQRRQEILNDITDTVGSVFTGLTYGCARCHDHKYDPISQRDYYRLQAFFANVRAVDDLALAGPEEVRLHREKLPLWEEKTGTIRSEMAGIEEKKRKQIADENFEKFPVEIQIAIRKADAERTPFEWQMYYKAKPYLYPDRETIVSGLAAEPKKRWQELKKELDRFQDLHPGELPVGSAVADAGREAPRTHLLAGGAYDAFREEVEPGLLSVFDPGPARIEPPRAVESTGRRSALAGWLADPANPLTPRVMVNRVWQYHFGRGIVATASDLGAMGDPPSHPDLLDWLSREFVRDGWSLKRLHRLIMTSAVYRQASRHREEAARIDPQDRLLWRFPRARLEGEVIRDAALAVSGLLNLEAGGPSVFPEIPEGMQVYGKWSVPKDPSRRDRRSIYVFVRRNTRYPLFEAFDMPDTHESCARRHVTITAPQALMMLNGRSALRWAQGFAGRLLAEAGGSREAWIGRAYRLAFSRSPDRDEKESALAFLERQRAVIAERAAAGESLALPQAPREGAGLPEGMALPGGIDRAEGAALVDFCHMLLNANEFIYRN